MIVPVVETWLGHCCMQAMVTLMWKGSNHSKRKVMARVFWDAEEILLVDILEGVKTVTSYYKI